MIYSVMSGTVSVSATASSVGSAISLPSTCDGLLIVNTGTTDTVTVAWGTSAPTATLYGGLTLPAGGATVVTINPQVAFVAAIGSSVGPNTVVFTPVKVGLG